MNRIKKNRGLKRYYRNLTIVNDLIKMKWLDFEDPNSWFDNWHLHFDWKGFGNNSFKRRKPHLDKLFRHFNILEEKTKLLKMNFQLYTILYDYDSYSDALFLFTPNPNNSHFPLSLEGLSTKPNLSNKFLEIYIQELQDYEKLYGIDEKYCLVYKKNIGLPFL